MFKYFELSAHVPGCAYTTVACYHPQRYENRRKYRGLDLSVRRGRRAQRSGATVPCFVTTLLEEARDEKGGAVDAQRDFDIRWTANSMYSASMDTTITVVQLFLLAMILHPEVLHKAQAELDKVVGGARLPRVEDRAALPYVNALMQEVFRWHPVVPLSTHPISPS